MNISFRSGKTEVRESPIHGQGLFAREDLAKNEIIAIKGGHIVTQTQWAELEPVMDGSEIQICPDMFITPVDRNTRAGGMLYINHSCDPNAAISGQIVYLAMRDIAAGEEITADWATTDDLDYQLQCHCGSPLCRGVITGKDWQKKELQEKYAGWFCWFLQRKIDALTQSERD